MPAADTHRWPRATLASGNYGRVCACGNLKTDQALTCAACAAVRRRAPDYDARLVCPECGGPKSKTGRRCRPCQNAAMSGVPRPGAPNQPQPRNHPWRRHRRTCAAARAGVHSPGANHEPTPPDAETIDTGGAGGVGPVVGKHRQGRSGQS